MNVSQSRIMTAKAMFIELSNNSYKYLGLLIYSIGVPDEINYEAYPDF